MIITNWRSWSCFNQWRFRGLTYVVVESVVVAKQKGESLIGRRGVTFGR